MEGFSEVLQLLHEMESKLTAAIVAGVASVNVSVGQLSERHSMSLLEQERKNSTFADRDRVESISGHVHDTRNEMTGALLRVGRCEQGVQKVESELARLGDQMDSRSLKFLGGINGYLVTALLIGVGSFLTYVFTHLH